MCKSIGVGVEWRIELNPFSISVIPLVLGVNIDSVGIPTRVTTKISLVCRFLLACAVLCLLISPMIPAAIGSIFFALFCHPCARSWLSEAALTDTMVYIVRETHNNSYR